LSYTPAAATDAAKIDGFSVPTPGAAEDEKVLTFDNDTSAFKFTTAGSSSVTMGGDVTGNSATSTVEKVRGKNVPAPGAPEDEKMLVYDNDTLAFKYVAQTTSVTMGGDLSGLSGNATVIKIQNKSIPSPGAGEDLKFVQYNDSTGQFQYATSSTGSVAMGGDVTGNSATCTVIQIRNKLIPAPLAGDDLKFVQYNNSSGQFQYAASTTSSVTMGGDVTGASNTSTVEKIRGKNVPAPGAGEDEKMLVYDNDITAFKYVAQVTAVTMGGDVTGSSASAIVAKIEGKPIPTPGVGDDLKFIQYNNTSGEFQYASPAGGAVTMGGDVTGSSASCTVAKIEGKSIPTPGAGDDLKFIQYNNTSGAFQYATAGGGSGNATSNGAFSTRPAAGTSGNLFLPSDGYSIERDTGAIWVPWGPIYSFTPPVNGDFSWANQGTASVTAAKDAIVLTGPAQASGSFNYRVRFKTAPATPWTLTVYIQTDIANPLAFLKAGILFRQSSDGKLDIFEFEGTGSAVVIRNNRMASPTSNAGGGQIAATGALASHPRWFRIGDNGTNRTFEFSANGQNWVKPFADVARTTFLTADQIGFCVDAANNSGIAQQDVNLTLLHWLQA
jgi:hypothetical protein